MLRGLWKLTWLEIKIFLREPLGAVGSILFPVLAFVLVSRFGGGRVTPATLSTAGFLRVGLPVFISVLIALSGIVARHHHLDLPRRRHSQTPPPRYAADHPHRHAGRWPSPRSPWA